MIAKIEGADIAICAITVDIAAIRDDVLRVATAATYAAVKVTRVAIIAILFDA